MERKCIVSTVDKAVEMMANFLSSQLVETTIDKENGEYFVKLAWLSRDIDSDEWIGCPCFVADFRGKLLDGKSIFGIVYVKCFPTQTTQVTKMKVVDDYLDYKFNFIEDGEEIKMHDERNRYPDEVYLFTNGSIEKI